MARIPDDEIERLKNEICVERLVESRRRTETPRRGPDRAVSVSRRQEPSLVVSPERTCGTAWAPARHRRIGDRLGDEGARA